MSMTVSGRTSPPWHRMMFAYGGIVAVVAIGVVVVVAEAKYCQSAIGWIDGK